MVKNTKIALLGGDRRQIYALSRLAAMGRQMAVYGIHEDTVRSVYGGEVSFFSSAEEAIDGADVILLPFPATVDGVRINCPLDHAGASDTKLACVLRAASPDSIIVGGKLPKPFAMSAREKGVRVYDLLESELFEMKNAYITAEAALSVAMNALTKNIRGARIAVTGFGRISKHLCRLLSLLGASVSVAARRDSDLALAASLGYHPIRIDRQRWYGELTNGYDIIFNTVPTRIFESDFFNSVDRKTLLVELASAPGGFDIGAIQATSANVSWALSLPGKYAPESAGEIIAEGVEGILLGEVSANE